MTRTLMIGGSGRSGTTVLCRAMGKHPDLSDVPEWRFTADPDGVVDFYTQSVSGVQTPFHLHMRIRRLERLLRRVVQRRTIDGALGAAKLRRTAQRRIGRILAPPYARTDASKYSPNFHELVEQLLDKLTTFTFDGYWVGMPFGDRTMLRFSDLAAAEVREACSTFLRSIANDVARRQGAQAHLEKNTWNILMWDRILELLPDSRLVHIVRDPRDVVASYLHQPWSPSVPDQAGRFLTQIMNEWERISRSVPSETFMVIRLEDLAADPRTEFARICTFWNLPWNDTVLGTPLSTQSFGRWKRDLNLDQQRAVSTTLAPLLQQFGYEP